MKLVAQAEDGYVGEDQGFSSDEVSDFLFTLPGVTDYDYVRYDVDQDGAVGEDEAAHLVEYDGPADKTRLERFLPDAIDTAGDGPVVLVDDSSS